jgi:RNA 3'-terminal phosphate cyclase
MKTIELKTPTWRHIRQTLSLSLLKREPVVIKNGFEFIGKNYDIVPLYNDLKRVVSDTGAGMLGDSGGDIFFNPEGLSSGTLDFVTDKYSSISEVELFLLPALFYNDFRSVINYSGVTHSHLSYPTTFLKETFFSYLEMTGHYASLNLKRFGFYGSGGGSAESRIYPAEPKRCGNIFSFTDSAIEGVRILMARMNMEMAHREREFIIKNTGVDESRVQIMEIVDADGYGNSIHVYVKCGGVNIILSCDMELYNSAGDFVFEESRYYSTLTGLLKDVERLVKLKTMPEYLMDEVLPYLILSGSDLSEALKSSESYRICSEFL